MAFNQRKFAIRVQRRDASRSKPQRISLVSQRRIVVNGKVVKAGAQADLTNPNQLRSIIAKPKLKAGLPATGRRVAGFNKKNLKAKTGNFYAKSKGVK